MQMPFFTRFPAEPTGAFLTAHPRGFTVLDSRSNFLFVRTARQDGGTLYRKLKENGVLVRHFDAPRIHSWLRITIGTPAQMQALLAALDKILED